MYHCIWHWVFPERHAAHSRNWAQRNPAYQKQYDHKRNQLPERKLADLLKSRKREAIKRNVSLGDCAAIKKIYARAAALRQWFDVVVDHKVPLAKGGAHASKNLQIIYRAENQQKGSSLTFQPTVIFQ